MDDMYYRYPSDAVIEKYWMSNLPAYAELHCKTNFSFLEGASHADELVKRAVQLGYHAIAITDCNSLTGIVRAHSAVKECAAETKRRLKLLIGAEVTPVDASPVVLWAPDRRAYGQLSHLITVGRRRAEKGSCNVRLDDIARHAKGLIAGVSLRRPLEHNESTKAAIANDCNQYRDIFGDAAYLLAELHKGPDDCKRLGHLVDLSSESRLPLVAAGDVHYHAPERMVLHDILIAIKNGTTVELAGDHLFENAQRHLRTREEILRTYAEVPDAIARTIEIADRCNFSLDELRYEYPEELAPDGSTPIEFLTRLAWKGANRRYPDGIPDKVRRLIEHELKLIDELRYEAYFLTVWDLVRFARRRGILCQGRGSAANSVVCFCLGVTSVDPDRIDTLFERFVSKERNEAPDIDVDFEHERREEVIQYLYEKYGRNRAGIAAAVTTYRIRSAVRDVGKALGLSLDRVDALAKQVESRDPNDPLGDRCRQVGIDPDSEIGRRLTYCINELVGFPRHLSQHVGGMVITRNDLSRLVPIENAAMDDRTVISWDKNDLEELGILKVDCLSLGMLTAIRRSFDFIESNYGRPCTLANIPEGDPAVYDMICKADTVGVFQIESRAQMSMLPRLKPRCYYDLVIEVAIVRPGPIQGQMVHPYLRRRMGKEEVTYPNEEIRAVLEKTMGVPIFQEQAMKLAVVAAGFTPGEADQLRRAMGKWRKTGVIEKFRHKLLDGMLKRNLSPKFADQVFRQIRGFGEYGFPESHAASFALLVYVSSWIKYYYPEVFLASLINSQPMGFYAPSQLIRDAREHDVRVLPIDVNHSDWDCTLEVATDFTRRSVRLGLRLLNGFSQEHAELIVAARRHGLFTSLQDFTRRTKLSRAVTTRLSESDAFASIGRDRRSALWEALAQDKQQRDMPLFDGLAAEDDAPVQLPQLKSLEQVFIDYQTTGLSLRDHPVSFYRSELDKLGVVQNVELQDMRNNSIATIAGLVILRQRPQTAKGITFVTLEDESGVANLVLHVDTWKKFYSICRRSPAWIARGRVESKYSVIHLVVEHLEDFSEQLQALNVSSRDFR